METSKKVLRGVGAQSRRMMGGPLAAGQRNPESMSSSPAVAGRRVSFVVNLPARRLAHGPPESYP